MCANGRVCAFLFKREKQKDSSEFRILHAHHPGGLHSWRSPRGGSQPRPQMPQTAQRTGSCCPRDHEAPLSVPQGRQEVLTYGQRWELRVPQVDTAANLANPLIL